VIVAVSTSSPYVSVALFSECGALIQQIQTHAPRNASGAAIAALDRLLNGQSATLAETSAFLADIGPGGFTGVKVGVTLAKTWAMATQKPTLQIPSFDLIAPNQTVYVPYKRGSYLVREPGRAPAPYEGEPQPDWMGYGWAGADERFPDWALLEGGAHLAHEVDPIALVPLYVAEPNISVPKTPYRAPLAH